MVSLLAIDPLDVRVHFVGDDSGSHCILVEERNGFDPFFHRHGGSNYRFFDAHRGLDGARLSVERIRARRID